MGEVQIHNSKFFNLAVLVWILVRVFALCPWNGSKMLMRKN